MSRKQKVGPGEAELAAALALYGEAEVEAQLAVVRRRLAELEAGHAPGSRPEEWATTASADENALEESDG